MKSFYLSPVATRLAALALICGSVGVAPRLSAVDYTWDGGGGDNNWGTADNWNPSGAPAPGSGNDLIFTGSTRLTPTNNYTAFDDFRSILFDSNAGSFTLTGNAVDLFWKVENNSTNTQTIGFDIASAGTALEFNPLAGNLVLNSANIYNNGDDIIAYGGNQGFGLGKSLTISGNLQGAGKLIVRQDANVIISGASSYTGNTEIDRGDFRLTNNGAIGAGTIFVGNGGVGQTTNLARFFVDATTNYTVTRTVTINPGDTGARVVGGGLNSSTVSFTNGLVLNGPLTLNAAAGGTLRMSNIISGNGRLTKIGNGTLLLSGANSSTGGITIAGGVVMFANATNLGNNPGSVVGNYLTLSNGGTLSVTAAAGSLGNRGVTVGEGGGTIYANSQNYSLFGTAETLLGTNRLILRGGGRSTFAAPQTNFTGVLQLGNGSGAGVTNQRTEVRFFDGVAGTSFGLNADFEFNDPTSSGPLMLSNYGTNATVTVNGDIRFTSSVFEQSQLILSRYNGGVIQLGTSSVVSAASGVTGWLGVRAGGDGTVTNRMTLAGSIQNGSGVMSLAFTDGGGQWMSYRVTGSNSYTGGGTVLGTGPSGRYGNLIGTHIQQGTVLFNNAFALGANSASNGISVFRQTGGVGSRYAGLLSDSASDITLGNGQKITVRPLNSVAANVFTIGGNQAVNTVYNNAIEFTNPTGGGQPGRAGVGLLLSQVAGGRTTFTNQITATGWTTNAVGASVFEKVGGGTVVLQAQGNYVATPVVRAGTLQVDTVDLAGANSLGALGNYSAATNTAGFNLSGALQLGGYRPSSQLSGGNVRIATVDNIGGTYSATGGANGIGQITGVANGSTALNGTTLAVNDRILVLFSGDASTANQGVVAGVYVVTSTAGTVTLDRVNEGIAPGSYVTVSTIAGKVNSGKQFYLANQNLDFANGGATGTVQLWLEDEGTAGSLNPTFLIGGIGVTVNRPIVVNASPFIGSSTLGSTNNVTSIFGGTITLSNRLQITSAATGSSFVRFTNVILGNGYSVTKIGDGQIALGANNTYTGSTIIAAGTVQVGEGGATGTIGFGNVTNNGALVFNRNNTLTLNNLISGTGTVRQIGVGTTIFASNNTYSGSTLITNGTLQAGNGGTNGTFGTGAILLANGANVAVTRGDSVTLANDISGTGNLLQSGAGTTVLTSNNSYIGATVISAGTLQVGNGGTTGSLGTGNVTNNANLVFNRGDNITVGNAISGSGALRQDGAGQLILTNINSYSGPTTIANGELHLGAGGTFGSIGAGAVTNNGALVFNRSGNFSVANVISGTGAVRQVGSGITTVSGSNSFSGGVRITQGSILATHNNALGVDGNLVSITPSGASAASLRFSGGIALNQAMRVDNSTGVFGTGFRNTGGSNTLAGLLTLVNTNAGVTRDVYLNAEPGTITSLTGGMTADASNVGNVRLALINFLASNGIVNINSVLTDAGLANKRLGLQIGGGTEVNWNTAGTLSGDISVARGTLNVNVNNPFANVGAINISDGSETGSAAINVFATGAYSIGNAFLIGNNNSTGVDTIGGTHTAGTSTFGGTVNFGSSREVLLTAAAGGTTLFSGDIVDGAFTGSIGKVGDGKVILSGTNTYDGATTINAGVLQVGNGGLVGRLGNGVVTNNAVLAFDRANTLAVSNAISGVGSLIQQGSGETLLTAVSGYTGNTYVSNGTLRVNGDISSSAGLEVLSGATLAGTGKVGSTFIDEGGRLAPGNSPGILTVTNDLTLSNTSQLDFEIGAITNARSYYDAVVVQGGLTLDGVLNISNWAGGFGATSGTNVYALFDYDTLNANNGVELGNVVTNLAYKITAAGGQVDLSVKQFNTGASFTNDAVSTTLFLNFRTNTQSFGSNALTFNLFNYDPTDLMLGLELTNFTSAAGPFSLAGGLFSGLLAGSNQTFTTWMDLAVVGIYSNQFVLDLTSTTSGYLLSGLAPNQTLTVILQGEVVAIPEPGSVVALLAVGGSLLSRRRRRA